jgi:hypothetical protein
MSFVKRKKRPVRQKAILIKLSNDEAASARRLSDGLRVPVATIVRALLIQAADRTPKIQAAHDGGPDAP